MTGVFLSAIILPLLTWILDRKVTFSSHFLRCLVDNFGHGLISAFIWAPNAGIGSSIFVNGKFGKYELLRSYSQGFEVLIAFVFACGLDIDHFIAGGALTLQAATTLPSRPFGHSFLFIFISSVPMSTLFPLISSDSSRLPHFLPPPRPSALHFHFQPSIARFNSPRNMDVAIRAYTTPSIRSLPFSSCLAPIFCSISQS